MKGYDKRKKKKRKREEKEVIYTIKAMKQYKSVLQERQELLYV